MENNKGKPAISIDKKPPKLNKNLRKKMYHLKKIIRKGH